MKTQVTLKSMILAAVIGGMAVTLAGIWGICCPDDAFRMGITLFVLWMTGLLVLIGGGSKVIDVDPVERNARLLMTAALAIGALMLVLMIWDGSNDARKRVATSSYVLGFGGLIFLYVYRR